MSGPLCIYHANCPDGFTAAWVVRNALALEGLEVELFGGVYGEPSPSATGRGVFMVDFTYPNETMLHLAEQAEWLVVLDHHQTAFANLANVGSPGAAAVTIDMERSGARLAWDHFYGEGSEPPAIVRFVEDRDLWRFQYPETPAYFAALTSHPYTLEAWDAIATQPLDAVLAEGRAIERYRRQLIELHLPNADLRVVAGVWMPAVNCPYTIASDVAGELAKTAPRGVAAYYYDNLATHTRHWGLRSTEDGPDVAVLAESMGGGGHKHAAGFREHLW